MFRRLALLACWFALTMPIAYAQDRASPALIVTPKGEKAIELSRLKIESDVSGGLAETTVTLTFYNPNQRALEGDLQFPLLEGQQITAFALDINGKLRRAVPVEKAKGRQVFEEIERRNVDPGLLENTQGENFKLRIYPIAAKGVRTVELRYSEPLKREESGWRYSVPLSFGQTLEGFELSVRVRGARRAPTVLDGFTDLAFDRKDGRFEASLSRSNYSPRGTLALRIPVNDKPQTYVQRVGAHTYFLAEFPLVGALQERKLPSVVGLLWDSSGSAAGRSHDLELALLDRYFRKAGDVEVRLIRLRDRPEPTETFWVRAGNWESLRKSLAETVYDGASALGAWKPQADVGEYLLFSDGLGNYGNSAFPDLAATQRLYSVNSATTADTLRLNALAERNGGRLVSLQANALDSAAESLLLEGPHLESLGGEGLSDLEYSSRYPQNGMVRVAGRMLSTRPTLLVNLAHNQGREMLRLPIVAEGNEHPLAASLWANFRIRRLEADPDLSRATIRRIGKEFSLPTRETSLIVLDNVSDYVRYEIVPPDDLRTEYARLIDAHGSDTKTRREANLAAIVAMFEAKLDWWNRSFPKGNRPRENPKYITASRAPAAGDAASLSQLETVRVTGSNIRRSAVEESAQPVQTVDTLAGKPGSAPTIVLKKWTPDAPYIARLKAARREDVYRMYLDEKADYPNSSAFYLDVADLLFEKGERELALRVLSNLAEMDLENRQILRILGYRLMQADAPDIAVPVFEKVLQLGEEEPQSFRDLGLAYAAVGRDQEAIEHLYEVVERPWDGRFAEIELIALAELNSIIAASNRALDTQAMDPRLLKHMPLDLRVILTWDADNSDMDLWVTDPNGEKCFYGNRSTYQGGRMSDDFTGGYGPEEFSLRSAKPGKYTVEVNFFGNRQQIVAGATTLQVHLTTGFGTPAAKQQSVTLRLRDSRETVLVGEFVVEP